MLVGRGAFGALGIPRRPLSSAPASLRILVGVTGNDLDVMDGGRAGSDATPAGVPVTAAPGGPQASDGPGWRLLFLLVQGTGGEGARAVALLCAAVLVVMSIVVLVIASMQKLGPWLTASGTGGVLLATALGLAFRRWRITRR